MLHEVLLAGQPLVGHEEHNDGTHIEHALHDGHHGRVLIHATKCTRRFCTAAGQKVEQRVKGEQDYGQSCVVNAFPALFIRTHEEIGNKQDNDHC